MPNDTLIREMAATETEFRHGLALAFSQGVSESGGILRVEAGEAAMEISLERLPSRIIAALCLPSLRVRIRFVAGMPDRQKEMLARMDRAMQRGGG